MALRLRGSITIYPRTGLKNVNMSRMKTQKAINISTVHLLHPKTHAFIALKSMQPHGILWLKTREGEPAPGQRGGEEKINRLLFLCFFLRKQRRLKKKATNRRKKEQNRGEKGREDRESERPKRGKQKEKLRQGRKGQNRGD